MHTLPLGLHAAIDGNIFKDACMYYKIKIYDVGLCQFLADAQMLDVH